MRSLLLVFFISCTTNAHSTNLSAKGDWIQSCHEAFDEDYLKQIALIDEKEFLWYAIAHEDENCKMPYLIFSRKYKTLDLTKNEFEVTQVTYRSMTDEVTEALNLIGFCGFADWQTYEDKDVTGKTCGDFQAPNKGKVLRIPLINNQSQLSVDSDPQPYNRIEY